MTMTDLTVGQTAEAVRAFDQTFAEMDRVLWCLSRNCHSSLLAGKRAPVVEELVWTIKSWWGVQGVQTATKGLMAQALARMDWSPQLFAPVAGVPDDAEEFAYTAVTTLVETAQRLGVSRREFSLASKTLHWLLPWRVPIYDGFVRQSLGIPTTWDHPQAYRMIARKLFALARRLEAEDSAWMGQVGPNSPLRALDKSMWWLGGGSAGNAVVVREPWQVVYRLGLVPD